MNPTGGRLETDTFNVIWKKVEEEEERNVTLDRQTSNAEQATDDGEETNTCERSHGLKSLGERHGVGQAGQVARRPWA